MENTSMIYAVIPTGSRPDEYKSIYDWCINKGVVPITIATSTQAVAYAKRVALAGEGLNISRWWNVGIKYAYSQGDAEIIIVLNDDVSLPEGWLEAVVEAIRAGYTGVSTDRGPGRNTIAGYAFALDAKAKVLADENLVWWYGDDDIQRQCEALGGFGIITIDGVLNKYGDSEYSRFQQQIDLDRAYYQRKWAA